MKFLIVINKLNLSGSSTYSLTLASELKNKCHKVDVFTLFQGVLVNQFIEKRINVIKNLEELKNKNYNCILAQHSIPTLLVRGVLTRVPMVYISHGVLQYRAFLEQPPSIDINVQKYIAISEEVKENLITNFDIPERKIEIIRNFVDINRFSPKTKIDFFPRRVLLISKKIDKKSYNIVKKACKIIRARLEVLGLSKSVVNIDYYINRSDLVISLGRGILEAMSCGRAALVYDLKMGDGMITVSNINEIRKNNFSGRRFKINYDAVSLAKEIKKYRKEMGEINRKIILEDYSASTKVEKILKICQEAKDEFSLKSISIPYKEIRWFQSEMEKTFNSKSWRLYKKIISNIRKFYRFVKVRK